jgi:hypothetical protein
MQRLIGLILMGLTTCLSLSYGQYYAKSFPASAEVVDVTQAPYNANPNDALDDLAAIQAAIDDHPNGHHIIYLPKGTYYLSDTLKWKEGANQESSWRYTILQGYHKDSTIIRLFDNAAGYGNASQRRPMVWTGEGAAQRFRNAIRDLTFHTGSGNPGAVGLQFKASNQGGIFDVNIISGDGDGVYGIDFTYSDIPGPLLIKNVLIDGFDYGIRTNYNANSITIENITLRNQQVYGIFNNQQRITIRGLLADSLSVPAFFNANDGGTYATITDSEIRGVGAASSESAIINYRHMYAHNITVSGYERSINNLTFGLFATVEGSYVDEFTSHPVDRACYNLETSLGLTIEETPVIPWEDTASWVSVTEYGAEYDRFQIDDTDSIQAAMNSGASTIVFPAPGPFPHSFTLADTLDIPAGVTHIIGAESRMSGSVVRIQGGTDTLVIERFDKFGNEVLHQSGRVVVFKSMTVRGYTAASDGSAGDVFLEDVQGQPWSFKNQNVWARQFNTEGEELNVTNDGGNLWVLGYKTEKKGVLIKTINGGKTEVMGAFVYTNQPSSGGTMFQVEDASFSVAGLKELIQGSNVAFETVVEDIRSGDTTRLTNAGGWEGALIVAYPASGINAAPTVEAGPDQTLNWPGDTSTAL